MAGGHCKEGQPPRNWYRTHSDTEISAQRIFVTPEGQAGVWGWGWGLQTQTASRSSCKLVWIFKEKRASLCQSELVSPDWIW